MSPSKPEHIFEQQINDIGMRNANCRLTSFHTLQKGQPTHTIQPMDNELRAIMRSIVIEKHDGVRVHMLIDAESYEHVALQMKY